MLKFKLGSIGLWFRSSLLNFLRCSFFLNIKIYKTKADAKQVFIEQVKFFEHQNIFGLVQYVNFSQFIEQVFIAYTVLVIILVRVPSFDINS